MYLYMWIYKFGMLNEFVQLVCYLFVNIEIYGMIYVL